MAQLIPFDSKCFSAAYSSQLKRLRVSADGMLLGSIVGAFFTPLEGREDVTFRFEGYYGGFGVRPPRSYQMSWEEDEPSPAYTELSEVVIVHAHPQSMDEVSTRVAVTKS